MYINALGFLCALSLPLLSAACCHLRPPHMCISVQPSPHRSPLPCRLACHPSLQVSQITLDVQLHQRARSVRPPTETAQRPRAAAR